MIEFAQENVKPLFSELASIAKIHADIRPDLFAALPVDMSTYTLRDVLRHTLKTEKIEDPKEINATAALIDDRYASLFAATTRCEGLGQIEVTLLSGQNVVLAMDHGELIDAALLPLAIANAIKIKHPRTEEEIKKDKPYFFRTGLIVSRMVEFLAVKSNIGEVPVSDLFKRGFDRTYMTVPSTISTRGILNRTATKTYNAEVIREIKGATQRRALSNKRPMLLAVAAPGTVNKALDIPTYNRILSPHNVIDQSGDVVVVGQINYNITEFAKNALTYAATARLAKNDSDVRIDPRHLHVGTQQDVEDLAQKIVSLLQDRDPATHYMYDQDGNLPVIRKVS